MSTAAGARTMFRPTTVRKVEQPLIENAIVEERCENASVSTCMGYRLLSGGERQAGEECSAYTAYKQVLGMELNGIKERMEV